MIIFLLDIIFFNLTIFLVFILILVYYIFKGFYYLILNNIQF